MADAVPVGRGFARVIVSGEGFSGGAGGAQDGRDAVVADFVGFEDDATVEDRRVRMDAVFDVFVPELDVAALLGTPVFIEIDEDIEATVEFPGFDVVEVDVNVE